MQKHVPRLHVHRLVYVLMGAALAVGLLVSFLMRPEPKLAAAQTCYSSCQSVTTLSLSNSRATYGHEHTLVFSVTVSAASAGSGMPTGSVVVVSGTRILCSVHLSSGMGHCSPAATALGPHGTFVLVAQYAGDTTFSPSSSTLKTLTIVSNSVTSLTLSTSTVTYGHENVLRFTVKVTGSAGVPTGNAIVMVTTGGKLVCATRLSGGKGTCSPTATALAVGSHLIMAHYNGNTVFNPSNSGTKTLTVKR
jgi:Bacterial Ig-like domain (group 3)